MSIATPSAHRIGKPIMLSKTDIKKQSSEIENEFGDYASLHRKQNLGIISWEEAIALQELENLRFLAGKS